MKKKARRAAMTGSIVAATAVGAASMRRVALKKRKFAANTVAAARTAMKIQASGVAGACGAWPDDHRMTPNAAIPPKISKNNTFTTPYRGTAQRANSVVPA